MDMDQVASAIQKTLKINNIDDAPPRVRAATKQEVEEKRGEAALEERRRRREDVSNEPNEPDELVEPGEPVEPEEPEEPEELEEPDEPEEIDEPGDSEPDEPEPADKSKRKPDDAFELNISGKTEKIPRQKAVEYAQLGADFEASRSEFRQFWADSRDKMQQGAMAAANYLAQQEQDIYAQAQSIQDLRLSSPEEHSRMVEMLKGQLSQVQQAREQAHRTYEANQREWLAAQREYSKNVIRTYIPNFGQEDSYMMGDALKSFGFKDAELGDVTDPRLLLMAHAYSKLQKQAENTAKGRKLTEAKLRKARVEAKQDSLKRTSPKGAKTATPNRDSSKARREAELSQRFKKTGHLKDAASLIETKLFG